jgi:uncharacterized protein
MRNAIGEIIKDFQATDPQPLTIRDLSVPELPERVNKPFAFIGMRRVGKTFLMYQILQELLAQGIPKEQIIYINFEDERLEDLTVEKLHLITDVHSELFPMSVGKRRYLFLDEIQTVNQWEKFVRRTVDNEDIRVYLTGSSSKMLSTEIATSLRGRSLSFEVSPFSFPEYLKHLDIEFPKHPHSKLIALLKNRFREYLVTGGFPETIGMPEDLRIHILQEYVNVAMHRDIVERHQVKNPEALKALVKFMLDNAAGLFSVNKAYNVFRSQGRSVSKDSLYRYLDYVQDAFLLFPVELYAHSRNKRAVNPKKLYAVDPGLITAFSWKFSRDMGALLENTVYCELRRRFEQINYYKTGSGKEVDFICISPKSDVTLFQVSVDVENPETLERETRALVEAMDELDMKEAVLINLDDKRDLKQGNKTIHVLPAYTWFLNF